MTAPFATPAVLRDALVGAGVLHLTSVDGVLHRSEEWEQVLHGVERHAAAQRVERARPRWFPPVLPRADLARTDYLRSFPDLVGSVAVFSGDDAAHRALLADLDAGGDGATHLSPGDVALPSSVCHSLYGVLPADVPTDGLHEECSGWCFRHEPSTDPARMQAFRMYEFVRVGTPAQAVEHRDAWLGRGLAALRALGLTVRSEAASDPFFGRAGRLLAAHQLDAALKHEVLVDLTDDGPTAVASTNYHEDHFGHTFGLRLADGSPAHSACFGFGLDRVTLALFATHGTDLVAWPDEVKAALRC